MKERDLVEGPCGRRFLASVWLLQCILASYLALGVLTSGERKRGGNSTGKVSVGG